MVLDSVGDSIYGLHFEADHGTLDRVGKLLLSLQSARLMVTLGAGQLICFLGKAFFILIKEVVHPLDVELLDLELFFGMDLFGLILSIIDDTVFREHFLGELLGVVALVQRVEV